MANFTDEINILQQIEKARDAIKQKYKVLKSSKLDIEKVMNETFKPIVQPLEKLVNVSETTNQEIKNQHELAIKNKRNSITKKEKVKKEEKDEKKEIENDYDTSFESARSGSESIEDDNDNNTTLKSDNINEYLQISNEGKTELSTRNDITEYLQMLDNNKTESLDTTNGVRKLRGGYMIGNASIYFNDNYIIIDDRKYVKSQGLVELIFKKEPNKSLISNKDMSNYGEILNITNAYRKYYKSEESVREQNTLKYKNFISKLIKPSKRSSTTGKGLTLPPPFKIARRMTNFDYIYWDDPNELVERLKLLLAEKSAGNQNHINEIHSIIEELREANIIH